MIHRLPRFTLFPYTTLFRSISGEFCWTKSDSPKVLPKRSGYRGGACARFHDHARAGGRGLPSARDRGTERSEEHTSELQSLRHLVCRLLLEKKKKIKRDSHV